MKQKLFFVLVLALCFTMAFVHAEETESNESAEDDMHEAEIMHLSHGSEIRLMQLQERIGVAIEMGEHILSVIEEKDYNVTEDALSRMEAIVSELKDIKEDVADEIEKNDTETSVEFFVETKSTVINLTQEFKRIAWEQLKPELRKAIKEAFKEDADEESKKLREKIKEKVKEFNRNRAKEMMGNLSDNVLGLIDKYANGELNFSELRQAVKEEFTRFTPEKKREFLSEVKEDRKQLQTARIRAFAEKSKLGEDQVSRMKAYLDDKNLTYGEAKAKLGVFMREKWKEKEQEIRKAREEKLSEIKERIRERVREEEGDEE